jgi:hypothetical protein
VRIEIGTFVEVAEDNWEFVAKFRSESVRNEICRHINVNSEFFEQVQIHERLTSLVSVSDIVE